jgi:hypothetical protein
MPQASRLLPELWGAAQAVESVALLIDDSLPEVPIQQWSPSPTPCGSCLPPARR